MEDWRRQAACAGLPAELWFPEVTDDGEDNHGTEGKRICADCPSQIACLDFAIRSNQQHGIWGGVGKDRRLRVRPVYLSGDPIAYQRALGAETTEIGRTVSGHEDERPIVPAHPCPRCGAPVPAGRHPTDRNGPAATCGKPSTYNKGCRCDRCRRAKADYHRERKAARRARPESTSP